MSHPPSRGVYVGCRVPPRKCLRLLRSSSTAARLLNRQHLVLPLAPAVVVGVAEWRSQTTYACRAVTCHRQNACCFTTDISLCRGTRARILHTHFGGDMASVGADRRFASQKRRGTVPYSSCTPALPRSPLLLQVHTRCVRGVCTHPPVRWCAPCDACRTGCSGGAAWYGATPGACSQSWVPS